MAGKIYKSPPELVIKHNKKYYATMKTSIGDMEFELFHHETPVTVNNFVFLSRDGFYKNNKFHRVVRNFMVQGGCPKGDGTGSPGYKFKHEHSVRNYTYGSLSMVASSSNSNSVKYTNGSQFFIAHNRYPVFDIDHTIFGQLINGADILDTLSNVTVNKNMNSKYDQEISEPDINVLIYDIEIMELEDENYDPDDDIVENDDFIAENDDDNAAENDDENVAENDGENVVEDNSYDDEYQYEPIELDFNENNVEENDIYRNI